ncbi:MAG: arginyl-tRNA synthetase, partial [Pseudonocardiales bacterium]|nr:arginyl-tRNA synthetase [Pseudonocardiales bacterium]
MASVPSLSASIQQRVADALGADPLLRRSDRADFQANGVLGLAKRNKANPREVAAQVVEALPTGDDDGLIAAIEVSGPGFLNITVSDAAITRTLAARADDDRLGVPVKAEPGITVVDYAQPNVAKEMHVGHLRSSVIGDAITKILEFEGEKVIRRHHIGDWGTQFGMLVQYLIEHPHELDHEAGETAAGEE